MNIGKIKYILLLIIVNLFGVALVAEAQVTVTNPIGYSDFTSLITNGVIPAVTGIIGAFGTLMIIWAGFLFLTSAGNPQTINKAKTALAYAAGGIIIAASASAIIAVINSALGK